MGDDMVGNINWILKEDKDCEVYLPLSVKDDSVQIAFQDGIVMASLIGAIDAKAIDLTKLHLNS